MHVQEGIVHPTHGTAANPRQQASNASIYAPARHVDGPSECYFYHSIELPGHGLQEGEWDLRSTADQYLGNYPFAGKRVLEIGSANGFLSFHMERQGAEVVAYDLSGEQSWDLVPARGNEAASEAELSLRRSHIRKLNNAWWLAHRLLSSKARVVYGTAYEIPDAIGMVDVVTLGSVLLHLRDPLRAMSRAAQFAREALIVTEVSSGLAWVDESPIAQFLPSAQKGTPPDTWWRLSPKIISEFGTLLGFDDQTVTYHLQEGGVGRQVMYTVVLRRG
jgi:SAM-dependent methyltransferase